MDNLFGWAAVIVAIGGVVKIWYDVRQVHTIVNSQKTAMQEEIKSLRVELQRSVNKDIPVTQQAIADIPAAIKVSDTRPPPLPD